MGNGGTTAMGSDVLMIVTGVVFESLVRSGFLAPRALDRDRDWSFKSHIVEKTGPNRCEPVLVGLLWLQDRSGPVLVQTGSRLVLDRSEPQKNGTK